jgi:hypothetical protein
MVLMIDFKIWYWLLLAHWYQAMPSFSLQLAESLALCQQIRVNSLMASVVMKPNEMSPDH